MTITAFYKSGPVHENPVAFDHWLDTTRTTRTQNFETWGNQPEAAIKSLKYPFGSVDVRMELKNGTYMLYFKTKDGQPLIHSQTNPLSNLEYAHFLTIEDAETHINRALNSIHRKGNPDEL